MVIANINYTSLQDSFCENMKHIRHQKSLNNIAQAFKVYNLTHSKISISPP
jgi:hypothetical protein